MINMISKKEAYKAVNKVLNGGTLPHNEKLALEKFGESLTGDVTLASAIERVIEILKERELDSLPFEQRMARLRGIIETQTKKFEQAVKELEKEAQERKAKEAEKFYEDYIKRNETTL